MESLGEFRSEFHSKPNAKAHPVSTQPHVIMNGKGVQPCCGKLAVNTDTGIHRKRTSFPTTIIACGADEMGSTLVPLRTVQWTSDELGH